MNRTLVVVSHTHWDREWYLPFEAFRARLVRMMDADNVILSDHHACSQNPASSRRDLWVGRGANSLRGQASSSLLAPASAARERGLRAAEGVRA